MELTKQGYDYSQLILKNFGKEVEKDKHLTILQREQEKEVQTIYKAKNSIDYSKFQKMEDQQINQQEEINKVLEENQYLKNMGCNHDRRKERDLYDKPTSEKLEIAVTYKQEGNTNMKDKNYEKAAFFYQKGIIVLDYTFSEGEVEDRQYNTLLEQLHMNLALVKFHQNDYEESLTHCYQTLRTNKNNIKAIYRQAVIYMNQDQFDKCQENIDRLKLIDQNNKDILVVQQQLKEKQENYQKSSKQTFQKMFN